MTPDPAPALKAGGRRSAAARGSFRPRVWVPLLFLFLPLFMSSGGCGRARLGLREMDACEGKLKSILDQTLPLMESGDPAGLRMRRDELVRLRLELQDLRVSAQARSVREALLEAVDSVIDGVGAAALGAEEGGGPGAESAARRTASIREASGPEREELLSSETARLRRSAAQLQQCEAHLRRAADALGRAHEERSRLEGGS